MIVELKYSFASCDLIKMPVLLSIGCSSDINETRFGPATRNEYLIHYVVSGKGFFNGNAVGAGEGFLISPNTFEHYYSDKDDPWTYLWFISKDPEMEYFFKMHSAEHKTGIFRFHHKHIVENIIEKLKNSKSNRFFSSTQITEYFLTIYNNCISTANKSFSSSAKVYFDFSVNYINSNLCTEISVEGLCKKLGISQPYLYKIFKNECGRSPKQYILDCKLAYAEQLLVETDLFVSEIAVSVGFFDALAFSRFFSKKTGESPREYRKSARRKGDRGITNE